MHWVNRGPEPDGLAQIRSNLTIRWVRHYQKGEKWPAGGFVDPCARSRLARPENYFSFDTLTGEVIPKDGITPARRNKARSMINDLRLNEVHHLRKTSQWLGMASRALVELALDESDYDSGLVDVLANRNNELSSITRVWLSEQGYPV